MHTGKVVMIDLNISQWTWGQIMFSCIWALVVLFLIYRFVYIKLWCFQEKCRQAIERRKKVRSSGFSDFRNRVDASNPEALEKYKRILSFGFLDLRSRLQRDELTAVEVLKAYVWKAMQVQERLNCCMEVIKEAFDVAAEADSRWSGVKDKPPMYGIPFSVKGNFYVPGYDCCIGLAKFLDQPQSDECSIVTHLRNLGAIPFVITNVPQALLSFVCSNSVYGTTLNPHDGTRTPGGSSGGEGALFAAGGTPFGMGSDLAGSLRIPAAFCGLVTLKPTQDRLVVTNTHAGIPGRSRFGLSFGFFTKTVQEQVELLKLVVGNSVYRQLVPTSVPAPLDEEILHQTNKLRIGYFDSDGFCPPVPCARRAVLETVERLKREGHELIPFTVPNVDEMVQLLYKLLMPDGGHYIRALYENDIIDPYMKEFVMLLKVPRWVKWLASFILGPISPQLSAISSAYVSDLDDLRYTNERCDTYKEKFVAYWKSLELDALLCPSFPVPPVPHRFPSKMSMVATYTALFNMLDFPAGVVPAGKVTAKDDEELLDESKYPVGHNVALRIIRDASVSSVGLPLSVQIVTLPFEEEKCLCLMREVERVWSDGHRSKETTLSDN
ncbi:hypothetical protein KIN20_014415 [Parelaphostrongylus tenuis]|uniref:Amidase domain-containing protein n=1 Tax=Parelaphostrongylus tenuis TaxID=148309 RepID=A0AAD5MW27_PARTN|nr:hypothetical protein KIN20_014415 [Parelaphostrongylus tenuis]